jgi:AcrR family transcriptional regulator
MAQTKDRLIDAAQELFYREGVHAVGLDQILDEVGVTKTTFYNHFESKDGLVLGVLEARDAWWRKVFAERLRERAGDDPAAQLRAIFDVLDEFIAADAFNGCLFVNVAVEFPRAHAPAHRAAAEHKELMGALLRDLALRAGARDPVALAEELALLMEGSYVTRQVSGKRDAAAIGRRAAEVLINRSLDDDAPGRRRASPAPPASRTKKN